MLVLIGNLWISGYRIHRIRSVGREKKKLRQGCECHSCGFKLPPGEGWDPSPAFAKLSLAAVRTSASQSPKRLTTLATTWPGGWQEKGCWEKTPGLRVSHLKSPASKNSQRLGKIMTFYFSRFLEDAEKMKKTSSKDIETIPFKPSWGSLTKVIPWMCFFKWFGSLLDPQIYMWSSC